VMQDVDNGLRLRLAVPPHRRAPVRRHDALEERKTQGDPTSVVPLRENVKASQADATANTRESPTPQGHSAAIAAAPDYSLAEGRETGHSEQGGRSTSLAPHREDIDQGLEGKERAEAARRAASCTLEVLYGLQAGRGRLSLVSLSLNPPPSRRTDSGRVLRDLGASLAGDEGLLLISDVEADGRWHFHGLGLLQDRRRFMQEWAARSASLPSRQRAKPVTGSRTSWDAANEELAANVEQVLRYAFARKQEKVLAVLGDRLAVAAGRLAGPWASAGAQTSPPQSAPSGRVCRHCHRSLPASMRSHAKWCSHACRQAAYLKRRAWESDKRPIGCFPRFPIPTSPPAHPYSEVMAAVLGPIARVLDATVARARRSG
jgi:hypothetical protein